MKINTCSYINVLTCYPGSFVRWLTCCRLWCLVPLTYCNVPSGVPSGIPSGETLLVP